MITFQSFLPTPSKPIKHNKQFLVEEQHLSLDTGEFPIAKCANIPIVGNAHAMTWVECAQ